MRRLTASKGVAYGQFFETPDPAFTVVLLGRSSLKGIRNLDNFINRIPCRGRDII